MHAYNLDCPICMNSFKFEHIRSLPCGHTYCSSCVDKLVDDSSTCPECRQGSGSQPVSTGGGPQAEDEGFIRQANHIAKRLRKINGKSSAQSVQIAADVIEDVAMVQCKEAQEIIWKAVREFWLRLVADFEQLELNKDFQDELSGFEQRVRVLDQCCSRLRLVIESERDRVQQYMNKTEEQILKIDQLTMAVHKANDEREQERERTHVLIARLRASEIKHRAQIKQLKKDLKSREAKATPNRPQLEEESLVVEPDVTYDESRSHRLDVYNEGSPRSKRRKLSPEEASSPADGFDYPLSADDFPERRPPEVTSPLEPQAQLRTGQSHQTALPDSDLRQHSPQRPKFGSDWNLSRQRQRRKLTAKSDSGALPFPLDSQGRPKSLLKYGSRVRVKTR